MNGFVKIHKKIKEWEWYSDSNMVHLFLHLIISANYTEKEWKGTAIQRGQLLTGLNSLNKETGISIQSLRTCLRRMEISKEITIKSTNKFSIITLCNYECYQDEISDTNKLSNIPSTNNQQTTNKQSTTTKEKEEDKEEKKSSIVAITQKFYTEELKKGSGKQYYSEYKSFISMIYKNNAFEEPIEHILKIKKQLTFAEYSELCKTSSPEKIARFTETMINTKKYTKDKETLFYTFQNWIKRDEK